MMNLRDLSRNVGAYILGINHFFKRRGGLMVALIMASVSVFSHPALAQSLLVSEAPNRSDASTLVNATISNEAYIFVSPVPGGSQVRFFLDDPQASGAPRQTEGLPPYDFAGTGASRGIALPFDTSSIVDGEHNVTAIIRLPDGTEQTLSANFIVDNVPGPNPSDLVLRVSNSANRSGSVPLEGAALEENAFIFLDSRVAISTAAFYLDDPQTTGAPRQVEGLAPYDFAGTGAGTGLPFDTTSIENGSHIVTVVVSLPNGSQQIVNANFSVENLVDINTGPLALRVSDSSDRSGSVGLDGTTISNDAFIFLSGSAPVSSAAFFLDDPNAAGLPQQTEGLAPYDFAGTRPDNTAFAFNTQTIANGNHSVTVIIADESGVDQIITANFLVDNGASGNLPPIARFVASCSGLSCMFNAATSTDSDGAIASFSWDFGDGSTPVPGSATNHTYASADTFPVTLTIVDNDGASASQTIAVVAGSNVAPIAAFSVSCDGLTCDFNGRLSSDSDGGLNVWDWDFGDGASARGPNVSHTFSESGRFPVTLIVLDNEGAAGQITREAIASGASCPNISNIDCPLVRADGSFDLEFDEDAGGLQDANGIGTGFTMVDPGTGASNTRPDADAPGLLADNIFVDANASKLRLTTTPGIRIRGVNTLDNALGFGLNVPSANVSIETTLSDLPTPVGGASQAGLWFGRGSSFGLSTSEENYLKLVIVSFQPGLYEIEALLEINDVVQGRELVSAPADLSALTFKLDLDPANNTVVASYNTGGDDIVVGTFTNVPRDWFSFDQAATDPTLGTRSFAGIFATHRSVPSSQVYSFDRVQVTETPISVIDRDIDGSFAFDRWKFDVPGQPTSAAYGPDGRVYVTTLFGDVYAIEVDNTNQIVVETQPIPVLRNGRGNRLTLGMAVDPASTPSNVILWVSHSSGNPNDGVENSGVVSRLVGPDFSVAEDVITGLPRAIANHAINGLDFGPDGRLYIAFGGNTGAGAANLLPGTEFRDRPEQPLSAAVLVADVNAPDFEGECATPVGQFGIPDTCDALVFASGLRNSYDLVWHSNGSLYATDNGNGGTASYPPSPTPDCTAIGNTDLDNPGRQPDLLYQVLPGRYYGHPNPYRNECVFADGSLQGVPPLANYEPPLLELGFNLSANAIIEYRGDAFFGRLNGQLLIGNWSRGDDITRTLLNDAGDEVIENVSIIGGFLDPLGLAQDPEGNIYVAEFRSSEVSVLIPTDASSDPTSTQQEPTGDWTLAAPLPVATLDADGSEVGGKLMLVAGETPTGGLTNALWIYDPVRNSWTQGPDLPSQPVEDPAVTSFAGKFYVFGGSTDGFRAGVNNAAVYDPDTNQWTVLASMPTPRGGATAQMLNGQIYVIGGFNSAGQSITTVEIYDPATDSWATGPELQIPRDNPGSAVSDGILYVFGGRTAQAGNNTLSSVEIFNPIVGEWTFGADMPTGRRSMSIGTVGERIQVVGGENPAVSANEEYNPATNTWRTITPLPTTIHGAAAATIGGRLYIVGGGPVAGSSFTDQSNVFRY